MPPKDLYSRFPGDTMTLELGDHVWYWNHKISFDVDIPRLQWFPGADPAVPTDYQGHGREIYNFVIHRDFIARGQPQMKTGMGTYAWLDNNPGNIVGFPGGGGPDFGQYQGKFNWHHFLIFPSYETGFKAIATLLRGSHYRDLSILDAFKRYAPESDGNDPVAYANAVAAALGVPVTTVMKTLTDDQMKTVQKKIQEIEGYRPGTSLPWDSPDLPAEISRLLPAQA
jgi:hypothetical protein